MVIDKRSQMIEDNIGLVHSVAKRFRGRGVDYEDLFQSGCIGLIKAVDNFDEEKGFQFSTYAVPVIMGEIKRVFRDGGAIKVGRTLKEKSMKAQFFRDKFQKKNCVNQPYQSLLICLDAMLMKRQKYLMLLILCFRLINSGKTEARILIFLLMTVIIFLTDFRLIRLLILLIMMKSSLLIADIIKVRPRQ